MESESPGGGLPAWRTFEGSSEAEENALHLGGGLPARPGFRLPEMAVGNSKDAPVFVGPSVLLVRPSDFCASAVY